MKFIGLENIDKTNRVIFKKTIFEETNMASKDREFFNETIDKINWLYSLKKSNSFINVYSDDERLYEEVEIFQIKLKKIEKCEKIIELIMKIIPYPILIIFEYENKKALAVSHQRFNKNDNNKIIVENIQLTNFKTSFDDINFKEFRFANFYEFYSDIVDYITNIVAEEEGMLTENKSSELLRDSLEYIKKLQDRIIELRSKLKKEIQFNKKLELNIKIKNIKKEIEEIKGGF